MSKKDPGKFTVRFNIADPQQREAAELLNRQGRSKAQFLTSAVLSYVKGKRAAPPHPSAGLSSSEVEPILDSSPIPCAHCVHLPVYLPLSLGRSTRQGTFGEF